MPSKATRGRDTTIYWQGLRASAYLNEYEQESEREDLEFTPFESEDKEYLGGAPAENTTTLTGTYNGDEFAFDDAVEDAYESGTVGQLLMCPGGILSGKRVLMLGDATVQKSKGKGKSDDINELEFEMRSKRQRGVVIKTPVPAAAATVLAPHIYRPKGVAVATDFGAVFSLHLEAVGGAPTGLVIAVEHSPDGTTYSALAGAAFPDVATGFDGAGFRLELPKSVTVQGYVRPKLTFTGGTTPTATFAMAMHRRLHG